MDKNKKLLLELICNEQTHMITKDSSKYTSEKYRRLEMLKIKIKDMDFHDEQMEERIKEWSD